MRYRIRFKMDYVYAGTRLSKSIPRWRVQRRRWWGWQTAASFQDAENAERFFRTLAKLEGLESGGKA